MLASSTELAKAARLRVDAVPQRLGAVIGAAVVLHLVCGFWQGWIWAAVYAAVMSIETVAGKRLLRRAELGQPVRPAAYLWALTIVSVVFGSISTPLTVLEHGRDGEVYGVLLLAGGLVNVMIASRASPVALLATMGPYGAYLLLNPLAAYVAGVDGLSIAVMLGGVLLLMQTLAAWGRHRGAIEAEHAAQERLSKALAEAEAVTAAKSAFVAMVSHELRTPLSGILAAGGLLESGQARDRKQAAEVVIDSGRFMQTLLDDLLDLAKLEAGRMTTEAVNFDIGHMVWSVERHWSGAAREAGKPLQLTSATGLPARVCGDPTRIRQILNNLLSNALKFTGPEGVSWTVDVCVGPSCSALGSSGLTVRVLDTGPGMTAEQLGRLFTAFDQTSDSVARTHGGTGLGLAVSRELARTMGGELSVESAPGKGSTFILRLPLAQAAAIVEEPSPVEAQAPARAGRVLVVDDHPINRRALELLLEPAGLEVTAVESGAAALEALAAEPFDVVLSDLHMPEMDGLALARAVRAGAGPNAGVPIVAVTGADSAEERAACAAAGMTGYVAKPIAAAALYAALEAALAEAPALEDAGPKAA
jgi:signal transduction histidine kinase/CheY-like chemotaxis protein